MKPHLNIFRDQTPNSVFTQNGFFHVFYGRMVLESHVNDAETFTENGNAKITQEYAFSWKL